MRKTDEIAKKVEAGERLTREEGTALLREGDFLELGRLADTVRWRKHPEPVVTYIIDRNINYTNVCTAQCAFCAFYRDMPSKEGYVLTKQELAQKIEETIALGGRQILLQGGLHPDLGIEFYEKLFRWMKAEYPVLWIHGLSPAEVQHVAKVSTLSLEDTLKRLMAAGLDSIPGGGAEILSDRVRKIIGIAKGSTAEWLAVMAKAHELGMKTTATMMFGHVETLEERVEHLLHLRDLQDRTGGFTAFIGWTFQPANTALAGDELHVLPVPADARRRARLPRQLPERPGLVGDSGLEDRPGVAALRRERLRLADDRGERGLGRGRPLPAHRGPDRAGDPGGRLRPQAPDDGLPDRRRPVLLVPRDAPPAGRTRRRHVSGQLESSRDALRRPGRRPRARPRGRRGCSPTLTPETFRSTDRSRGPEPVPQIIENCLGSPSRAPQYRQLLRSAPGGAVFSIRSTILGANICT